MTTPRTSEGLVLPPVVHPAPGGRSQWAIPLHQPYCWPARIAPRSSRYCAGPRHSFWQHLRRFHLGHCRSDFSLSLGAVHSHKLVSGVERHVLGGSDRGRCRRPLVRAVVHFGRPRRGEATSRVAKMVGGVGVPRRHRCDCVRAVVGASVARRCILPIEHRSVAKITRHPFRWSEGHRTPCWVVLRCFGPQRAGDVDLVTSGDVAGADWRNRDSSRGVGDRRAQGHVGSASGSSKFRHRRRSTGPEPSGTFDRTRSLGRGRWPSTRLHSPPW